MLDVVMARAVGFPDIDFNPFDGIAVDIFDGAQDEAGLTVRVV